ncbi:hypothetical protein JX265_001608 [Neoarthrinium moseri]|uniref:Uncharacterized protein n=1 Tax=Neoarthrinium moseri TaxID=1658444 RepID=A0A9P9WVC0_9PEZI|nr:uncharacterized protein JN550_004003 [Neoarthrinium moseri]KAI1844621.1 hypothetical protein JX266_009294 [Neoarthrinium moseri]KAI1872284.1 hypothetical protein JN550_004003 [Neoarthrinium moseri]KAI1879987.1 hypothetical protein JX265_001608 [Neoarthrinium moseri]
MMSRVLHVSAWSFGMFVLFASAHQGSPEWVKFVSLMSFALWLASGVVLVLTELDVVTRRPVSTALLSLATHLFVVTCGKAEFLESLVAIPIAINIATVIVLNWDRIPESEAQIEAVQNPIGTALWNA